MGVSVANDAILYALSAFHAELVKATKLYEHYKRKTEIVASPYGNNTRVYRVADSDRSVQVISVDGMLALLFVGARLYVRTGHFRVADIQIKHDYLIHVLNYLVDGVEPPKE